MEAQLGAIVHYTTEESKCRLALIIDVENMYKTETIRLAVYNLDSLDFLTVDATNEVTSHTDNTPGTWHWQYPESEVNPEQELPTESWIG
jgi:hypothetical protein